MSENTYEEYLPIEVLDLPTIKEVPMTDIPESNEVVERQETSWRKVVINRPKGKVFWLHPVTGKVIPESDLNWAYNYNLRWDDEPRGGIVVDGLHVPEHALYVKRGGLRWGDPLGRVEPSVFDDYDAVEPDDRFAKFSEPIGKITATRTTDRGVEFDVVITNPEVLRPSDAELSFDRNAVEEAGEDPTPREEFESQFGEIDDEQWQWLKEFVKRNDDDVADASSPVVGVRTGDYVYRPSGFESIIRDS